MYHIIVYKQKKYYKMYFEKCFDFNNKTCIKLSQLRRNLIRKPSLDKAIEYYNHLQQLPLKKIKVNKQPLFKWEKESSCILYEMLNLENTIADKYTEQAIEQTPKEARKSYLNAMKFNIKCLTTLKKYRWKDNDIIQLNIMQDNYHYSKLLHNAAMQYYSMHQFKNNLICIRRAYHLMDFSINLWKTTDQNKFKSLTLLEMAKSLPDDQMGERLALIKDFKDTPECSEYWNTWFQQNETVYYKSIETNITIQPFTLKEAFQDLSKLTSDNSTLQKD